MSQTLTAQEIIFVIKEGSTPEAAIAADSGVQAAAALSLGQVMLVRYQAYYTFPGGVPTPANAYIITFIVNATDAATIVSGVPALQTRIQAIAPQVTHVYTWAHPLAYA